MSDREPADDLTAAERAALMDMLWDSMSDAQQAAWLQSHCLEYADPGR